MPSLPGTLSCHSKIEQLLGGSGPTKANLGGRELERCDVNSPCMFDVGRINIVAARLHVHAHLTCRVEAKTK